MRYTRRNKVAKIINYTFLPEAMAKLAAYEDVEEQGCSGCQCEHLPRTLYPCRLCLRDKEDRYKEVID